MTFTHLIWPALVCALGGPQTLLPVPQHVQTQPGRIALAVPLVVDVRPPYLDGTAVMDARVTGAIERLQHAVAPPPGQSAVLGAKVVVAWRAPLPHVQALEDSEAYTLVIDKDGVALDAQTPLGVLRGLETLKQWLTLRGDRVVAPFGVVEDTPRFAWRGLMIDVSRHFMPVDLIKKELDAMASVKLNVLHWHLTDDQGFRYESRVWPRLHGMGAEGAFYTQQELRDVVAHAAHLGIRVVPEIDVPGHVDSWLLGYPHLASGPPPTELGRRWGILDAALDPTKEQTYAFLDGLIGELATLFPDTYLHIGGDENNGKQWQAAPHIVDYMAAHNFDGPSALQAHFIERVVAIVTRHQRSAVGWDDIVHPGLPSKPVIQSWSGGKRLRAAIDQGHRSILSHGYYMNESAEAHYLNDPSADWPDKDPELLVGGEACQWTELVSASLLDLSLWPRAAAIAERFWSPKDVRDVPDMYRRLQVQLERLKALGVSPTAFQDEVLELRAPRAALGPLRTLLQALEGRRVNWWPQFRYKKPLDQFADVLDPESLWARQMLEATRMALDPQASPKDRARARARVAEQLRTVVANHPHVLALEAEYGHLEDACALSQQALLISRVGLQAMAAHASGQSLGPTWLQEARVQLDQALNKELGARVAFAPAIELWMGALLPAAGAAPAK